MLDATNIPEALETVFRVAPENIMPLWPQLEPMLEIPLAMRPTHNAEDVRKLLMAQAAQLWIQFDSSILEAYVITEFTAFPRGVWVNVWLAAAREDARFDYWRFTEALTQWAKVNGCRGVSGGGRVGWLRKLPQAKFEGVLMRTTFE